MSKYANLFKNIPKYIHKTPSMHTGNPHPESLLGIYLNDIGVNVFLQKLLLNVNIQMK